MPLRSVWAVGAPESKAVAGGQLAPQYPGRAATIYTVLLSGSEQTVFDNFLEENEEGFKDEIKFIVNRLYEIGHRVGAREGFLSLMKVNQAMVSAHFMTCRIRSLDCIVYDMAFWPLY